MRKACWCSLGSLALCACSLSSTDNTVPTSATAGAAQTSTSGAGGRGVGGSGGSGESDAARSDASSGGGNDASGGVASVVDGAVLDAPAMDTEPAPEAGGGDGPAGPSGDGGSCAGLFCEDFEHGQIDPAKWDIQMGAGGTHMVQQDTVAHGKNAWHVHGTGARGDFAMILTKSAPPGLLGPGPVFGRAYFYTTPNNSPHVELGFAGTTGYPKLNYMEFAEFGSGSWQLGFDLFTPAPSVASGFVEEASYTHPTVQIPVMTWSCIEWEFNDNPDMMVLWVDGKQVDQFDVQHIDYTSVPRTMGSVLNGKSAGIIGGFAVFGFGFHSWGASRAFDIYYDDIVLDVKRVNCLP